MNSAKTCQHLQLSFLWVYLKNILESMLHVLDTKEHLHAIMRHSLYFGQQPFPLDRELFGCANRGPKRL